MFRLGGSHICAEENAYAPRMSRQKRRDVLKFYHHLLNDVSRETSLKNLFNIHEIISHLRINIPYSIIYRHIKNESLNNR